LIANGLLLTVCGNCLIQVTKPLKQFKKMAVTTVKARTKRSGKTIHQQYCLYLGELEKNAAFRTNKYSPNNPDVLDNTWEELAIKLNSSGGPKRTVVQWKKVHVQYNVD
jgi:hypothetical protein